MVPISVAKKRTGLWQASWRRTIVPYLFVVPAVLIYFVFKLAPLIGGIYLALLRWNGLDPARFVGLGNFLRMLEDEAIPMALLHNVQYAFGTVTGKIVLSLLLALLLNQALRGRGFYRTALFMPVVMSFVVVGILWSWLYDAQFGLVDHLLRTLGLDALIIPWLGDPQVALWSLVVVDIWKWYGFHMVIFLAGLQTIAPELYEAARIDGASRWRQFTRITLPLLQSVMLVNVTTSLMGAFNVFDIPFIMTDGGPANATLVMRLHIYTRGFKFYRFGYGAAMSYALLLLVTVIAAAQIKVMSRGITEY
jgi:ABC-type sugar transport system permease subunit